MTDYKKFLIYIGTTLAIVLPFPGRIAYGIFALLHFNVSVVLLTLMFYAINLLNVKFLRLGICSLELVALTILYKQLLVIFCPVAALTIGFSFYLPAVSAVVITIFNLRIKNSIKESCLDKLKKYPALPMKLAIAILPGLPNSRASGQIIRAASDKEAMHPD